MICSTISVLKKLLTKIIFALVTISASTSTVYAYGDYIKADTIIRDYENKEKRINILTYFSGLRSGYEWANTFLNSSGEKLLFCKTEDASIDVHDAYMIYKNEYLRNKTKYDEMEYQPAGAILLLGLEKKYPC